ncbi:LAGLIDADG family homing endonuclease [Paenibacillus xylanexedens]|uniref:LAGLIDADG family homing endonuclease n=1 Tax=Paenibacillus xylanexedens TaxID=528191 RepID=UPI00119FF897|nr:LAGLIDADG family homing endonuclease [Paenibacillus xylanexedens]
MGYGDKTLAEWLDGTGPRGQRIPNNSINLNYFITEEQFKDLFYEKKLRYREILEIIKFPYNPAAFSRLVRRLGWKAELGRIDTYSSDGAVFDNLTRQSAWMYGWIITDGHVNDKYVGVRLQSSDIDVVRKIQSHIKFDGPLYEYPGKCEVRAYNRKMVTSLRNLGIPKRNKTFNATYPENLPEHLLWDFIRGAFEGDGCVSVSARGGTIKVSLCGAAESFMLRVNDILVSEGINVRLYRRNDSFITLHAVSQSDALRWLYLMYRNTDVSIRMDRKFNKFVEFVRTYHDRSRKSAEAAEVIEQVNREIPECTQTSHELIAA